MTQGLYTNRHRWEGSRQALCACPLSAVLTKSHQTQQQGSHSWRVQTCCSLLFWLATGSLRRPRFWVRSVYHPMLLESYSATNGSETVIEEDLPYLLDPQREQSIPVSHCPTRRSLLKTSLSQKQVRKDRNTPFQVKSLTKSVKSVMLRDIRCIRSYSRSKLGK